MNELVLEKKKELFENNTKNHLTNKPVLEEQVRGRGPTLHQYSPKDMVYRNG